MFASAKVSDKDLDFVLILPDDHDVVQPSDGQKSPSNNQTGRKYRTYELPFKRTN